MANPPMFSHGGFSEADLPREGRNLLRPHGVIGAGVQMGVVAHPVLPQRAGIWYHIAM